MEVLNPQGTGKMTKPKLVDDDKGTISISVDGDVKISWCYGTSDDRNEKMRHAWYWCDGFMAGTGAPLKSMADIAAKEANL